MNQPDTIDDREPSLAEHIAAVLASPQFAQAITAAVLEQLSTRVGGRRVYVRATSPTAALERLQRIEEVRAQWNGRNRQELCRRYRISRATFYRIVSGRGIGPRVRDAKAFEEAHRVAAAVSRTSPGGALSAGPHQEPQRTLF